jgi:hypothetical protein
MQKGAGGLIVQREYANDNTNRQSALAHSYTQEGRALFADAPKTSYVEADRQYVEMPANSFYSNRDNAVREYTTRQQDSSYIEELAA